MAPKGHVGKYDQLLRYTAISLGAPMLGGFIVA